MRLETFDSFDTYLFCFYLSYFGLEGYLLTKLLVFQFPRLDHNQLLVN